MKRAQDRDGTKRSPPINVWRIGAAFSYTGDKPIAAECIPSDNRAINAVTFRDCAGLFRTKSARRTTTRQPLDIGAI